MSKGAKRLLFLSVIVLIIFTVICLLIPVLKNAVYWTAVAFMILAFLPMMFVVKSVFSAGSDSRSRFYGFPIARVGACYLVIQMIVSII